MSGARTARVLLTTLAVVATVASSACGGRYSALEVGECLPADAALTGDREPDPPRVDCGLPHVYEVYAVGRLQGDGFPGEETVDAAALQLCVDALEPAIGIAPADTPEGSDILFVAPTSTSWARDGDRDVECVLVFDEERIGRLGGETER